MKKYKEFINEGLLAAMVGPNDEKIKRGLANLSVVDRIVKINKYNLDHKFYPSDEEVHEALDRISKNHFSTVIKFIIDNKIDFKFLPKGDLIIDGSLDYTAGVLNKLPNNLTIKGHLRCSHCGVTKLPDNLTITGHLECSWNKLIELPKGLKVGGHLECERNEKKLELPSDAEIGGYCHN